MTATDFLEPHVGRSVTIPDFHGYFNNDATIDVILFSETIRKHKAPKQVSQDSAGPWTHL